MISTFIDMQCHYPRPSHCPYLVYISSPIIFSSRLSVFVVHAMLRITQLDRAIGAAAHTHSLYSFSFHHSCFRIRTFHLRFGSHPLSSIPRDALPLVGYYKYSYLHVRHPLFTFSILRSRFWPCFFFEPAIMHILNPELTMSDGALSMPRSYNSEVRIHFAVRS